MSCPASSGANRSRGEGRARATEMDGAGDFVTFTPARCDCFSIAM